MRISARSAGESIEHSLFPLLQILLPPTPFKEASQALTLRFMHKTISNVDQFQEKSPSTEENGREEARLKWFEIGVRNCGANCLLKPFS
jgi:hypothetical protein